MSRPRTFLVCASIATALIAGCGGSKSSSSYQDVEAQLGLTRTGIVERQTRVEGAIRDCMKAQGFEYTPVDPLAQQTAVTGSSRVLSDEEFVKQFGYGISTMFGRGNAQSDPNDRIRKSLSAADRAAYDRALWGDNPGATFADAVDTGHFTQLGGCTKQATGTVFGGTAVLTALQGKLDELDQRILEDQRMVRANEKWSACLNNSGYQFASGDDIDAYILKRFQAIAGVGVKAGATVPPNPGTSYDKAALAALQREEVKVANIDLTCEKRYITPVDSTVRPQYEAVFRKQNRQLLSQVRPVGQ
jgi:hypothetical protein